MSENEFRKSLAKDPDSVLSAISKRIVAGWRAAVIEYDGGHPLNDAEMKIIESNGLENDDVSRRYGATLLIGVISDEFSFGIQIGDGALIAINEKGKTTKPMPDDEACFLNYTTSICASDAIEHFNWFYDNTGEIRWIMVATDGFTNSFQSQDSLFRQCRNISEHLESNKKWKDVRNNLEKRAGSDTADDTSLAAVNYIPVH